MELWAALVAGIVADIIDWVWRTGLLLFFGVLSMLAIRSIFFPTANAERTLAMSNAQGERLQAEIDMLKRDRAQDRAEIAEVRHAIRVVRRENEELSAWVRGLSAQVVDLGGVPVPRPRLYPDAAEPAIDDIYEALRTAYSLEELEVLAQDAGIAGGSIHGQTVPSYALHLYQAAERCGRMEQLGQAVRASRPHLFGGRQ